jgi:hypothetical protein
LLNAVLEVGAEEAEGAEKKNRALHLERGDVHRGHYT